MTSRKCIDYKIDKYDERSREKNVEGRTAQRIQWMKDGF